MVKEEIHNWQTKAFQAKTSDEWKQVLGECKIACEGDEKAYNYLKNYFLKIYPKKKEYFEKYDKLNSNKKQFPIKKTVLLDESLSKKIEQYYDLLILEKKLELKNKFNIEIK